MISNQIMADDIRQDDIAGLVDAVKRGSVDRDALVDLLPEKNPIYAGRGTNETIRMRGYILAAFERVGLPDAALVYVLEALESGHNAYLIGGAAKAVRGMENPTSEVMPYLFKAIRNIRLKDDALNYDSFKPQWNSLNYTTALQEIFLTFGWLGDKAESALPELQTLYANTTDFSANTRATIQQAIDTIRASEQEEHCCCCHTPKPQATIAVQSIEIAQHAGTLGEIEMQDQDGYEFNYGDFFGQTPTIVVFFYTRCNNPNKCSLSISKLAKLQQSIRQAGLEGKVKTAAVTYDPEYDLPTRLKMYGENRGYVFTPHDRFLRTRSGFDKLADYFQLGVNFNQAIVNQHRIELFVLDARGEIGADFVRLQWENDQVLQQAQALIRKESVHP
jgi:protein SCO1